MEANVLHKRVVLSFTDNQCKKIINEMSKSQDSLLKLQLLCGHLDLPEEKPPKESLLIPPGAPQA